jgi:hippurate hydrolase
MGTFRALDETWRYKAHDLIRHQVSSLVEGMGAKADLHIDVGYPSVMNHEQLNQEARHLAEAYVGPGQVDTTEIRMGAEDFGFYTQQIPGCFFRLGTGNLKQGIQSRVHTSSFMIDEKAIAIGAGMMAWLGAAAKISV